jgi:hypothetical protein
VNVWTIGGGVLLLLGLAMCVWALITGRPAPDPLPVPRHAQWVGEGDTARLVAPPVAPGIPLECAERSERPASLKDLT